ncbi:Corrinoid adenosyltransferase [Geodia barretti]|uniref:Corrinoid adenosyltransferase n=1 Tax=Geodia barretti TaxID=519541 RepID=A0AA35R824_GEOBA|nr:Corrinoid adenosyltransferase [Geodia barretti]
MRIVYIASAQARAATRTKVLMSFIRFHQHASSRRLVFIRRLCSETSGQKLKIYTRQGDKGVSSTFSGQRLPKDNDVFEAVGTTDELNSTIGLAREFCLEHEAATHGGKVVGMLQEIQSRLFEVGAHVATPRNKATPTKQARTEFGEHHSVELEKWIDELDADLPQLANFILPSGGKASATLHLARTVCRRAERRLSDFLFTAARFVAQKEGKEEVIFRPENDK